MAKLSKNELKKMTKEINDRTDISDEEKAKLISELAPVKKDGSASEKLEKIISKLEAKVEDLSSLHGNNVHPLVDREFAQAVTDLKALVKELSEENS